jgi:hypothetical protein
LVLLASRPVRAEGVGFFVSDRGELLTALNVVAGCNLPAVITADGRHKASIRATSAEADLALLRIARPWPAFTRISLGSLGDVRKPVAIVRYFWFEDRGLAEILPARFRGNVAYAGGSWLFEVSSPIENENGGSPVISENGEVVAIVVAKVRKRPSYVVAVDRTRVFGFLVDAGIGLDEIPGDLPEPPVASPAPGRSAAGRAADQPGVSRGTRSPSRPTPLPATTAIPPVLVAPATPPAGSSRPDGVPSAEGRDGLPPPGPSGAADASMSPGSLDDDEMPETPQTAARAFTFPVVCLDAKRPRRYR